jgi:hypothetical protein
MSQETLIRVTTIMLVVACIALAGCTTTISSNQESGAQTIGIPNTTAMLMTNATDALREQVAFAGAELAIDKAVNATLAVLDQAAKATSS